MGYLISDLLNSNVYITGISYFSASGVYGVVPLFACYETPTLPVAAKRLFLFDI